MLRSTPKTILLLFICIFIDCTNQISHPEKAELSLKIRRTACSRDCPVYNLTVQPDRKVVFEGIQNTAIKGVIEDNISREKINQLLVEINKTDFFSLEDLYTKESGNCPIYKPGRTTETLSVNLNGKEKNIEHDLGCWYEGFMGEGFFPQRLYHLEYRIDEIIGTSRWIGERE